MSEVLSRTRTMRMMNNHGHTSFGWDEDDDEWVLPMIRRKMAEGYVFWVVRRPEPDRRLQEVRLRRIEDIGNTRHVIIRDDEARELFEQGHIGLVEDQENVEVVRTAETAEEVVANDTVAHRPLRGG